MRREHTVPSRTTFGRLLCRACLGTTLLLTACVRVAVEARAPEPSPTRTGSMTVWVFAWGLAKTPKVTAECGDTHVYKATIHETVPGLLLALITLGAVVPARLEYVCAAATSHGIHGEPPP